MNKGFTLIEVVIYLALFTIIIGGGMVAVYQIIQSTDAGRNQIILQEEANFLLRKIDWTLTSAKTTVVSNSNKTLTIQTYSGSTLTFIFDSGTQTLQLDSTILNSSNIKISGLTFTTLTGTPSGIKTTFTLTTSRNGRNTTQTFSETRYLRQ